MFILKYSGLSAAYFFLRFVVLYFIFFSPKAFKAIYNYFHKTLKQNTFLSLINIFRNYYVFGQILIDKVAVSSGFKNKFTFNFDGEEFLRDMVSQNNGALLISAHIGNFELAGNLLQRLNTRINIVIYDAEIKNIKAYLSSLTKKLDVNFIILKDDFSHIYELNTAFENKEIVCMHGDRFIKGSKTIPATLLSSTADFPAGPFYLALKNNIPVSFVFAMKESRFHYHFYATPPKYYFNPNLPHSKRDAAVKTIIYDYISLLEKMLNVYPLQWFNYYEFWKS